jgi:hypothetical protein
VSSGPARRVLAFGALLLLLGLYVYGAMQQVTRVNLDLAASDQRAYMGYAVDMVESRYAFVGERNRMPVYPFLQSLSYRAPMDEQAFFEQGKRVNVVLSILLLCGVAAIVIRRLGWSLHAANVVLVIAFTIFMFKAGWFQAELLFYAVYFCLFVLLWRLLHVPSYWLAALAGVVAGIAHLTKAAVLPGLAIFVAFMGVQAAWWRLHGNRLPGGDGGRAMAGRFAISAVLVAGLFLLTVFPYVSTSKRVFGRYFYNVNSTFYAWYDSWDSVKAGTRAHGDDVGWPKMAAAEIPSLSKYLREHTAAQAGRRLADGARNVLHKVTRSYGYFKYLVLYFVAFGLAAAWQWRRVRDLIVENPVASLAAPAFVTAALILCFWFAAIDRGDRFFLIYFAPLLFLLASGLARLLQGTTLRIRTYRIPALTAANLAILMIFIVDAYFIFTERIGIQDGGS